MRKSKTLPTKHIKRTQEGVLVYYERLCNTKDTTYVALRDKAARNGLKFIHYPYDGEAYFYVEMTGIKPDTLKKYGYTKPCVLIEFAIAKGINKDVKPELVKQLNREQINMLLDIIKTNDKGLRHVNYVKTLCLDRLIELNRR